MNSKSFTIRRDICLFAILGSLVIALEWRAQDDLEAEFLSESQTWHQQIVANNLKLKNQNSAEKGMDQKREVASERNDQSRTKESRPK